MENYAGSGERGAGNEVSLSGNGVRSKPTVLVSDRMLVLDRMAQDPSQS